MFKRFHLTLECCQLNLIHVGTYYHFLFTFSLCLDFKFQLLYLGSQLSNFLIQVFFLKSKLSMFNLNLSVGLRVVVLLLCSQLFYLFFQCSILFFYSLFCGCCLFCFVFPLFCFYFPLLCLDFLFLLSRIKKIYIK